MICPSCLKEVDSLVDEEGEEMCEECQENLWYEEELKNFNKKEEN